MTKSQKSVLEAADVADENGWVFSEEKIVVPFALYIYQEKLAASG
jgi:hypothetical protein